MALVASVPAVCGRWGQGQNHRRYRHRCRSIGLAMIKKCSGFDMNILCYDPVYQNHKFIKAIQDVMDLRHTRAIQKDKTWIKYVEFEAALRDADYVSLHVPLLRKGEGEKPTYHLINENTLQLMKPTA